ncbi:thioredoxin fold domain-containing protein [Sulfurimonas sp. HSL-1716]|uniref:thioredoxin family protein n=1 Tax=Hydrocurvibacter sulfurireducens TaxID=3131937 RepID=UPI0031F904FD
MYKSIFKAFLLLTTLHLSLFSRDINIDDIVKKANQSHKHLFLYLHRKDCVYCEEMLTFTINDDEVKKILGNKFIYEHIDILDKDHVVYKSFKGNGKEFARLIGYDMYPTSIFFDKNEKIVYAQPGVIDKNRFILLLQYISGNLFKTIDFEDYVGKIGHKEKK